ncbi:MAG: hypothetical protein U0441_15800 [Polyangiaceae bacterium]
MASEKSHSTEIAIVLAGALIGGGLYFGLRGRESPAPPPAPVATSPGGAAQTPPQQPGGGVQQPGSPPPAAPALDKASVLAAATKDLERYRADVVKKCVEPAIKKQPNPPIVKLTFNVSFDAQGKQVMRGVMEDRETWHEGVSMCAQDTIPALAVPPPGANVGVDLPWTLP